MVEVLTIISEVSLTIDPSHLHDETVNQIESIFRKNGFYTTREYRVYKLKDGSGRAGRIDLVARKGKFRLYIVSLAQKRWSVITRDKIDR